MDKSIVIFAPHVDDELIGCSRILRSKVVSHVVYFYELDEIRKIEANECGKYFDFEAIFSKEISQETENLAKLCSDKLLYVPSIKDIHPYHKKINNLGRYLQSKGENIKLNFYSVDMNVTERVTLSDESRDFKKKALHDMYPSQRQLFSNDEKYHLFEANIDNEFQVWNTVLDDYGVKILGKDMPISLLSLRLLAEKEIKNNSDKSYGYVTHRILESLTAVYKSSASYKIWYKDCYAEFIYSE